MKGTGVDFLSPDGKPNLELSAKYFKAAGYASGKYEGTEKILMVGSNAGVAAKTAEVAKENFEKMGFKVQMRLVQPQTMYTRYCNTPSANVAVCPNVGWLKDFADGQTILVADVRRQEHPRAGQLELARARRCRRSTRRWTRPSCCPKEQRPAAWAEIDKMVTAQAPRDPVDLGQDSR